MGKGFIRSGILVITGRQVGGGGSDSEQVKGTINHFKIYTTWARILSDRNIFCSLWGRRTTAGYNAPGAFLVSFVLLFFVLTCSRPQIFARPNEYSSRLELVS